MFDMHTTKSQHSFEQILWDLGGKEENNSSRFVLGSGQREKRLIIMNAESKSKKQIHLYTLEEYFGVAAVDASRPPLPKVDFADFVLPASLNRYLYVEFNPVGEEVEIEKGDRMSSHARGRGLTIL